MDKPQLEELKGNAEARCTELFQQIQTLTTELERFRGEFRAYEALLLNWSEKPAKKKE